MKRRNNGGGGDDDDDIPVLPLAPLGMVHKKWAKFVKSVSRWKRIRKNKRRILSQSVLAFLHPSVRPSILVSFFLSFSSTLHTTPHCVCVSPLLINQSVMMALQISSSSSSSSSSSVTPTTSSIRSHNYSSVQRSITNWSLIRTRIELSPSSSSRNGNLHCIAVIRSSWSGAAVAVKCSSSSSSSSLETEEVEEAVVKVGQVTEVNKDTFWPIVKAAAGKTVVLDMYTQWCGPCKIIAPKFVELSEKYVDVVFLKLDCNQENKALAKELGIRVVPTFKILKEGSVVKEVTGAKFDDLVVAIETVRSSSC